MKENSDMSHVGETFERDLSVPGIAAQYTLS